MKRTLVILLLSALLGSAQAWPSGDADGGRGVRLEQAAAEPSVQGAVGQMVLSAGDSDVVFSVYSITGQLLRSVKVQAGSRMAVDMPKGFYIVRCGTRWSRKVVVR